MPTDRRIIFSTYVIPTRIDTMEEDSISKTSFQSSPNGTLGGNGVATINATQFGDDWTSMEHESLRLWEDFTTVNWEEFTSSWETAGPEGTFPITDSATQLTTDSSDLAFLYVKNVGTSNKAALIALDDTGLGGGGSTNGSHYIIVPVGGSVCIRGDGTNAQCREVSVKASHSDGTEIEYIIAKTP